MAYKREDINGTSPLDIKKINDNIRNIWSKVFGNINFTDADAELQKKILTQWLPVQGEGNFDKNFPLVIRFFVPNNTEKVVSSNFNIVCEKYRMDSGISDSGGGVQNVDISLSMSSSGISGSISSGGDTSSYVNHWGNWNPDSPSEGWYNKVSTPATYRLFNDRAGGNNIDVSYSISDYAPYGYANGIYAFAPVYSGWTNQTLSHWVDLATIQHVHDIPAHSHSFSAQSHSHNATGKVTFDSHTHQLKEGVKISTQDAQGVDISVNGVKVTSLNSASVPVVNNINISDKIKIGEWNIIQCTTTNLARITIYGTLELIIKSFLK